MAKLKGLKRPALAALIPGTNYDPTTFEVHGVADPDAPTIVFNIRGTMFETYRSNLYRRNLSNLSDEDFLNHFYREKLNDYFFDRDPSLFSSVLEYQRTGVLHIPSNVCGKVARQELEFWGISESKIDKCCWNTFDSWNNTYDSLKQLEETQKRIYIYYDPKRIANERCGRIKSYIWNFLSNHTSSRAARIYGMITVAFITLSVVSFIIATHPACRVLGNRDFLGRLHRNKTRNETTEPSVPHPAIITIDYICFIFFTCELILRFITCPNRKHFIISTLNIVDFAALIPDYIDVVVGYITGVSTARKIMHYISFFRIARALRIFRLVRYVPGLWILLYTFKASFWELMLMVCFMTVGMIIFATLIYYTDEETFPNIPIGLWWALITMTTVGYGDMYPRGSYGYIVGSLCAITGLLMVGFTVPIIVNHFIMYYTHMQSMQQAYTREKIVHQETELLNELIEEHDTRSNVSSPKEKNKKVPKDSLKQNTTATVSTTQEHLNQSVQTSLSYPPPLSYEDVSMNGSHKEMRLCMARPLTFCSNNRQTTDGRHRLRDTLKKAYNSVPRKQLDVLDLDSHFNGENPHFAYGQDINNIPTSVL